MTITSAIINQFSTSTIVGAMFGGIVGNRTDAVVHKSLQVAQQFYQQLTTNINEPANHDIQRAVRRAMLNATLLAAHHAKKQQTRLQRINVWGNDYKDLKNVEQHLVAELKLLDQEAVRFSPIETDLSQRYEALLFSPPSSSNPTLVPLMQALKESILDELRDQGCRVELALQQAILEGWMAEDGKKVDWYGLTLAFFREELKTNARLSTIIHTYYLQDIQISLHDIEQYIDQFYKDYQQLLPQLAEIKAGIADIQQTLAELPEEMRAIVAAEFAKRETLTSVPNFTVSDRYRQLTQQISQDSQEEVKLKKRIVALEKELAEATDIETQQLKQEWLNDTKHEQLQTADKRVKLEKELKQFVTQVLELAERFAQAPTPTTPRLQQAKALFEAGDYMGADKVLNEKAIYKDIKQHKAKAKELAAELGVKAQTTLINKPKGWFELANKYYRDAVKLEESYDTCFDYALFLQKHMQIMVATEWYTKALNYVETKAQKAGILNNLGNLQYTQQDYAQAAAAYQESLAIRRQLANDNPKTFLLDVAMTLNNLGVLQSDQQDYAQAAAAYQEALDIYRQLANDNPRTFLPGMADSLNNLGILQQTQQDYAQAAVAYQGALDIYRQLAKDNPRTFLPSMAGSLNNLGNLQQTQQDYDQATAVYQEALAIYRQLAKDNPKAFLPDVAGSLNNLGNLRSDQQDYTQAATAYQEALDIRKQLAKDNPKAFLLYVAASLNSLGNLRSDQQDYTQADAAYQEALGIRKQLAKDNPKAFLPYVADSLNNLGALQQAQQDYAQAAAPFEEALAIYRQLANDNPNVFLIKFATTAFNLAIFHQYRVVDRTKSIHYAQEAIQGFSPFADRVPFAAKWKKRAEEILAYWRY